MKPCETGSDLCCINKLKVEKGSILVYFKLVGTESEEVKLESAYKEFMNLLQSGKFTLVNQTSFHILHLTEKWFTHFAQINLMMSYHTLLQNDLNENPMETKYLIKANDDAVIPEETDEVFQGKTRKGK